MYTTTINIVDIADATPNFPESTWSSTDIVSSLYFAETRNITALTEVMLLTKVYTSPPKNAVLISGSVTVVNTLNEFAPRSAAASSIDGSICLSEVIPERTPIGRYTPYKLFGIQTHTVPIEPLLDKLGIEYEPQ